MGAAFKTLLAYVGNILENPEDPKVTALRPFQ
jgi:hypothetical protein